MPTHFTIHTTADEKTTISGQLTRQSIAGKQEKNFSKLIKTKNQDIDLSGIVKIDTAGLAWLLALFEFAEKKQIQISYSQAPIELVKLAKLSGVNELLPICG